MRSIALAASTLALLLATAAEAQTPAQMPPQAPSAAPAGSEPAPPLMTAPRPEDKATTDPATSPPGAGGSAPSSEMSGVAALPRLELDADNARELVGRPVQTRDGKAAGMIRDFTLGGPEGRIDQVVLGNGAFIGPEVEMVTVPATELRLDAPESASTPPPSEKPATRLSLDMTAEELNKATPFAYDGKARTLVGKE